MGDVLIVDDDAGIRETLSLVLEDAGYRVRAAHDGLEALSMLRATPLRMIVLLDLMMPRLDGAGVLGAVAADRELSSRHAFVLVTAAHQTMSLAFAHLLANLGVSVLHKPFDLDDLLDSVAALARRVDAPEAGTSGLGVSDRR